ncbi:tRNA (Guanine(26)-N(2))-dimethyltransferase [Paramyrothecium foliicola]|nr:tRNA (Guanine(26)-N(2))-dimethyltransferase [Paramyrothecium foliicola]
MPSELPLPQLSAATDVIVDDNGVVNWTTAVGNDHISIHEVVFVLRTRDGHHEEGYVICGLVEKADDKQTPFEAKFVSTKAIPTQLQQYLVYELPSHLRREAGNEVNVVVSTKSGLGHPSQFWQQLLQPLWALVISRVAAEAALPKVLVTEHEHSVRGFARELWASQQEEASNTPKSRFVVLLSGDGGVVDLLNGCRELEAVSSQVVIALLPLGTGNALFHSTHKPLYAEAGPSPLVLGLRSLFRGVPADLPVFHASFSSGSRIVTFKDKDGKSGDQDDSALHLSRQETAVSHLYGAIVASYGFHASIVYESDTPEYRVHGSKRFGMVAEELLRESHPYEATVSFTGPGASADSNVLDRGRHAYLLTTLVSNLERTFTISPEGKPLDGQLRLVHFGPVGGERTMEVMMKAYDGGKHIGLKWDDGEGVGYEAVKEVKIEAQDTDDRWRKVCIDGTIVELPHGGQLTITTLENAPCRIVVDPSVLKRQ